MLPTQILPEAKSLTHINQAQGTGRCPQIFAYMICCRTSWFFSLQKRHWDPKCAREASTDTLGQAGASNYCKHSQSGRLLQWSFSLLVARPSKFRGRTLKCILVLDAPLPSSTNNLPGPNRFFVVWSCVAIQAAVWQNMASLTSVQGQAAWHRWSNLSFRNL